MARSIQIAASMRSADWTRLGEELRALEAAGVDLIHCDASDGTVVPDLGAGPSFVSMLCASTALPIEIHLMVAQPERFVSLFLDAGVDIFLLHVENGPIIFDLLRRVRDRGRTPGVACWPATDASALGTFLPLVDKVSVMAIAPGAAGILVPEALELIRHAGRLRDEKNPSAVIQVDGAVSQKTRDEFLAAGAEGLVLGHPLFSRPDYAAVVEQFRYGE